MKILITLFITTILYSASYAQLVFINNNPNAALCKLEIANGKTTVFEEIDNSCPAFKTWNQVPQRFENNYSYSKYKMTVVATTSLSKRTYYIEHRILSGAGENRDKKNAAYVKLTIDYNEKGRPTKVLEEYFTIQ